MKRAAIIAFASGLLCIALSVPAEAATTIVVPGPGTPLQDAIDAAAPGDQLKLVPEPGFDFATFSEAIVIDKPLKIKGAARNGGSITIDAGCASAIAVDVVSDGVRLSRLVVQNAVAIDVNVVGHEGFRAKSLTTFGPGFFGGCASTQIGFNVENSTGVKIQHSALIGAEGINAPAGYATAAIRIANIAAGQRLKAIDATGFGSAVGLVLDDVAGSVKVIRGGFNRNGQGVSLIGVVGAKIIRNNAFNNETIGFGLDATSSDNRLVRNEATGNGTVDALDAGSGNCWRANVFGTGSVGCTP